MTEKVTTTWRWTQIELARRAGRCDADRALARLSIHMGENMQRFADRIAQYHKEVTP